MDFPPLSVRTQLRNWYGSPPGAGPGGHVARMFLANPSSCTPPLITPMALCVELAGWAPRQGQRLIRWSTAESDPFFVFF